jgi:SAM-dependent methyltransferase
MKMIITGLQHLAQNPRMYDLSQTIAGRPKFTGHFKRYIPVTGERPIRILDVGGGTGHYRILWPAASTYICLDLEWPKLQGFKAAHPNDMALQGDATVMPIKPASVDYVQCIAVSHHLTDTQFTRMLIEIRQVLKPKGMVVFVDPVWNPKRWRGKLLWAMDRGSYPRTPEQISELIKPHFQMAAWDSFAIHHEYIIGLLR